MQFGGEWGKNGKRESEKSETSLFDFHYLHRGHITGARKRPPSPGFGATGR
jgi:hypothetical protein